MHLSSTFLLLKEIPLLQTLSDSELEKLAKATSYKKNTKGHFLFREGQVKSFLYFVEKGIVRTGSKLDEDRILVKDIIRDKGIVGENIFTEATLHTEFAELVSDTSYFEIPIHNFRELVEGNFKLADALLQTILLRLKNIEERMSNFVHSSARERIVAFIQKMGNKVGIRIGIEECLINLGMSHKDIAFVTDTSRQTVARVLGEMKKDNLIHFSPRKPHKILIRDLAGLC